MNINPCWGIDFKSCSCIYLHLLLLLLLLLLLSLSSPSCSVRGGHFATKRCLDNTPALLWASKRSSSSRIVQGTFEPVFSKVCGFRKSWDLCRVENNHGGKTCIREICFTCCKFSSSVRFGRQSVQQNRNNDIDSEPPLAVQSQQLCEEKYRRITSSKFVEGRKPILGLQCWSAGSQDFSGEQSIKRSFPGYQSWYVFLSQDQDSSKFLMNSAGFLEHPHNDL